MKMKKLNSDGFTLIELIIVIAILAVLGSIAVSNLLVYVEKSRELADEQNAKVIADAADIYMAEKGIVEHDRSIKLAKVIVDAKTDPIEKEVGQYVLKAFNNKMPRVKSKKYLHGSDDIFELIITKSGHIFIKNGANIEARN